MAKAKKEQQENSELTNEQLVNARVEIRKSMKERFNKWMDVSDDEATEEDIKIARDDFDKEVAKYQNKKYVIAKDNALQFAELLRTWNAKAISWEKGEWRGVIKFDTIISDIQKELHDNPEHTALEVDYATLMYLHKTMTAPAGHGIEQARMMATLENYNPQTGEKNSEENPVTYNNILMGIIQQVQELAAADKKLKLMRERINIATAGIKFTWKITELEEFIELHDAWLGAAVDDNMQ